MSLLNEALRKNRMEKSESPVSEFTLRNTGSPWKKLIIILVSITVVFLIFFILFKHYIEEHEPLSIEPKNNNLGEITAQVNEPEISLPSSSKPEQVMDEIDHAEGPVIEETHASIPEKTDEFNKIENVKPLTSELVRELHKSGDGETVLEGKSVVTETFGADPEESEIKVTDNEESFYKKAVQFHRQGRLEDAVSMYKKVLNYNSENSDAMFNLASIYITGGKYLGALRLLKELESINPSDPEIKLNLAVAEIGLGRNRDAITHLKGVGENNPDLQFRVLFHRGIALSRTEQHEKAVSCYKAAEKLNRNDPSLLLNMAVLFDRLGRYKDAVEYYLKLINSDSIQSSKKEQYRQRIESIQGSSSVLPEKTSP